MMERTKVILSDNCIFDSVTGIMYRWEQSSGAEREHAVWVVSSNVEEGPNRGLRLYGPEAARLWRFLKDRAVDMNTRIRQ